MNDRLSIVVLMTACVLGGCGGAGGGRGANAPSGCPAAPPRFPLAQLSADPGAAGKCPFETDVAVSGMAGKTTLGAQCDGDEIAVMVSGVNSPGSPGLLCVKKAAAGPIYEAKTVSVVGRIAGNAGMPIIRVDSFQVK